MRILLTGGAGFIGSHAALLMLQKGYDLVVFDSFVNSSFNVMKTITDYLDSTEIDYNLKTIRGDIRNKKDLDRAFKDSLIEGNPIEAVIHFAGLKSVSESVSAPLKYWEVNVSGTLNLLETMKTYKCYSVVFSSSATIYGSKYSKPIKEDQKVDPVNPYGKTKVAIENMMFDLFKSNINPWRICSLRYFNPVGSHSSGVIGEDPIGIPSNLFPYLSQVAIGRRKVLKVFGDDWDTNDGTGVRDYIHIMDLAEGHLAALDYLFSKKCCYEIVNLGSGIGYSVLQIINEFQKATDCTIPFEIESRRDGDISISVADISKAMKLFDWRPKRNLKQMCLDVWNWQRNNPKGYIK
tara:strand:+ start:412 stop:1461 length:1050 start_codon:yes stop_codon:yes gene_type:complete